MAKNTGEGYRKGQQRDRYQLHNPNTDRYDKYDSDGNYLDTKVTPGRWKGVEEGRARGRSAGGGAWWGAR